MASIASNGVPIAKADESTPDTSSALALCVASYACGPTTEKLTSLPKGCAFSPDGLVLLAATEKKELLRFSLPSNTFQDTEGESTRSSLVPSDWQPFCRTTEPESIYDYAWYPRFDANNAATAVFASCCREQPIHLHEALVGGVRASYGGYNSKDELDTAMSIAFTPDGGGLLAGYDHAVMSFDISRPGREVSRWSTSATRRSVTGQKGLIGAIAVRSQAQTGVEGGAVFAAGSYDGSCWLYDQRTGAAVFKFKYKEADVGCLVQEEGGGAGWTDCTGHKRDRDRMEAVKPPHPRFSGRGKPGVTSLRWSHSSDMLYAGFRQAGAIACWDVRSPGAPLQAFPRDSWSQQRIGFDLDPTGLTLVTGGRDGVVRVYDVCAGTLLRAHGGHGDAVNGVSAHPCGIVYACAIGQRHGTLADADEATISRSSRPSCSLHAPSSITMWRTFQGGSACSVTQS